MLIMGYDPGGERKNGVALLHVNEKGDSEAWLYTCDSVDQALEWLQNQINDYRLGSVDAAGIDTYLSWSTGVSGWRPADLFLRDEYPRVRNSIFASNSAYGSMAVQGMAMALRLRHKWENIRLNETHPKVLYYALSRQIYSFGKPMTEWLLNLFGSYMKVTISDEHQWDALLSAWATWMELNGRWNNDLMANENNGPLLFPAGVVTYYWPEV